MEARTAAASPATPATPPAGPERPQVGRLALAAAVRLAAANLVGSVTVFVYFQYVSRPPVTSAAEHRHDAQVSIAVFVAYIAASVVIFRFAAQRVYPRDYAWAAEGRAPTAAERETVLHEPLRLGAVSLATWLGGAVLFIGLNLAFGNPAAVLVRLGVGIVFGGLTTSTLAFLLVERTLRPAFAYVLAGGAPRTDRYLGVRPRLMLSWAVGSGVPLLGIALAVGGPSHPADPAGAVVFLVAVGVIGGWLSMFVAARSVADPIEAVRHAVRQVSEGDLAAEVTVDDGGEVGLLQAGFNQMVSGLRERQRLRDLFGRHVGDEVARQALERGMGLGGEQREASALFIDLVGSTTLAAERPPHEVVATLNAMFDAVVRAVAAEGGWVNKFEGDAALCVFGAPSDQPDHAARALRAARGLRAALDSRREEDLLAGLDAGIGVSSGIVVAGNVGAEERYEYTVIGDPVNEAARLTELAKQQPGRVLASERAVLAANGAAGDWAVVGEFELRGRGGPTCAYAPRMG
jgi:adenylate cyclase